MHFRSGLPRPFKKDNGRFCAERVSESQLRERFGSATESEHRHQLPIRFDRRQYFQLRSKHQDKLGCSSSCCLTIGW